MFRLMFLVVLVASPAIADDAPTVTLTRDQLQKIVEAESARAVGEYISNEKRAAAKDAYEIVRKAFEAPAK